ncbi:MFS general substrate transporter [Cucurbitaria berberidis CBS 394.84]|uniref:MFS general substrate transporter n=1 Tax=Cucurbitaria berberidis CBS 394.84 TaxID=1168544 RepID=A0A9P4LA12_9PLEO|nr:MFS general substrate transporter [Cucurbitaria berberidis CBS 394.84]KAF1846938.1 MFS general substrate transporter [Cucurbitaria berberidis CBS 394.84]
MTASTSATDVEKLQPQDVSTLSESKEQSVKPLPNIIDLYPGLPPVDRGRAAWLYLAAAFVVEVLTIGFSFSFGRFQDFYSTNEPFAGSSNIAVIGVLNQGLIFICLPVTVHLARRKPEWARWFATGGLLGAFVSNIASSFCTTITQLIGTQGVLLGVCGSFAFCPLLVFADQWFDKRKGLAFGIIGSGAGLGGLFLPLIFNALLYNVGFRTTMRIWAGILFVIGIPLAYFVRPRLPPSATEKKPFWNLRAVRSRFFILNSIANLFQGAGYYLPGIYLPTFTREVFGASTWLATLSLMLLNLSAMMGLIIMGHFTDRWNSRTCIFISAFGATIAVFLFWGLAVHLSVLYLFCIFFGLFSGCFPAVWPAVMRETARRGEERGFGYVDTLMCYSLLCVGRGIGNIISGPLSEALIDGMPWKGEAIGGYGSGFGALIVFSGLTSLVSGMNTLWYHLL